MRYGFKTEAERTSSSIRPELGLKPVDWLDCLSLASYLGIPVVSLKELAEDGARAGSIARLLASDSGFSALTVCVGTRRIIVYNPSHPPGRRANSLAHELSHIILEHPSTPALNADRQRYWNKQFEDEADWQAGALLVPRDGALAWLKRGDGLDEGAIHFGVSPALFKWRVNQTGIPRQLAAWSRPKASGRA